LGNDGGKEGGGLVATVLKIRKGKGRRKEKERERIIEIAASALLALNGKCCSKSIL